MANKIEPFDPLGVQEEDLNLSETKPRDQRLVLPAPAFLPGDRVLRRRKDGAWDPGVVREVVIKITAGADGPVAHAIYYAELDRYSRKKAIGCGADELGEFPK